MTGVRTPGTQHVVARRRRSCSPRLSNVGTGLDVIVAALVGLVVGAIATLAFAMSERERRGEEEVQAASELSDEELTVLAAIPAITIVLDEHDKVLRATADALTFGLVTPNRLTHASLIRLVELLRRKGEIQTQELTLRRGPAENSASYYVTVTAAPLSRDRVLLVFQDHTKERRLEDMRRDFVANISHELKTPVGAMGLLAETVADSADEPEVVAHFAGQMKREAERLAHLVQDIIDLSRLQEPNALLSPQLVQVDDVITEAVDRVRVAAQARGVTITRGGDDGAQVMGDYSLLVTAVRNLLDNAIRYSPQGRAISVGVALKAGTVRIAVVDQGEGIPKEAQVRVFERFYRVDSARSRETGGTGLGLSIVKHIAADHGGEVELWSVPGRGSTFTLVLPLAVEEAAEE